MLAQIEAFAPLREFQHDPTWVDRNWGILFALALGALAAVCLLFVYWRKRTREW